MLTNNNRRRRAAMIILFVALVMLLGSWNVSSALAEETEDPKGKAMFRQLAEEERMHERILEDEFFSLSNEGVWGWSGLYGE